MAVLALEYLNNATIITRDVVTAGSATLGYAMKLDTAETTCTVAAATTDDAIGIAIDTATAGNPCRIALWGAGIVKGKVGTGGASFGDPLKWVADGLTTATVGGGTTKVVMLGQALQTGVATNLVGVNLGAFSFSVGS